MNAGFAMIHRVEFVDTDAAGIAHFSSCFRYMEVTEHAFFRSLGFSIDMSETHKVGWPRVRVECDYRGPLKFEDEVEVRLRVGDLKEKSVRYDFTFLKVNPGTATEVARGSMTVVCVSRDAQGVMKSVPIPAAVAQKLKGASA